MTKGKDTYLPVDVLRIEANQRYNSKLDEGQTSNTIKEEFDIWALGAVVHFLAHGQPPCELFSSKFTDFSDIEASLSAKKQAKRNTARKAKPIISLDYSTGLDQAMQQALTSETSNRPPALTLFELARAHAPDAAYMMAHTLPE
ncbi:hypothetical protein BU16DRAFT_622082 [Lophium mytilinum]|uniref:Protein kinase domain-containing protein n=1 Tax=Lophium mytilinum TaxID=390894 RepID=A0A6A6QDI2_9PEZI|nr:hypothetical protein BU16DRAFT_622082 [Lophium mytilinum]